MFYLMNISLSYYAQPFQQYKWEKSCESDCVISRVFKGPNLDKKSEDTHVSGL